MVLSPGAADSGSLRLPILWKTSKLKERRISLDEMPQPDHMRECILGMALTAEELPITAGSRHKRMGRLSSKT
jgi:hypothetical protein